MSATETYHFGTYTLRPAGMIVDFYLAHEWTRADPDHKDVSPQFWLEQGPDSDAYLLLDQEGPLYFARLIRTTPEQVEMHIQFPPQTGHRRVVLGLMNGMVWLEKMLRRIRIRELYFKSCSPTLIRFAIRRLGFEDDGNGKLQKCL